MKRSKLLVALSILGALLIISGGTFALASFLWSQTNPATVEVKGGDIALYSDDACTVELPSTYTLDFGEVRAEQNSDSITCYLKNEGTDVLFPVIWTSVANTHLSFMVNNELAGPATSPLKLYQPGALSGLFASNTLSSAITSTVTTIPLDGANGPTMADYIFFPDSGELCQVVDWDGTTGHTLTVIRGVGGTIAAGHVSGATVEMGTGIQGGDLLTPGEVLPLEMHLEAIPGAILGPTPFDVTIEATSSY